MFSDIRTCPSYSTFKKKILNFTRPFKKNILNSTRPCSNNIFNVSHPKGLIFLTRLHVDLRHLREHKFKHSFLNTINPIYICGFDAETLNYFFLRCPRFADAGKTFGLRLKGSFPTFLEKPTSIACGKVKHELQVTSYKFIFTNYEFKTTSYDFKSTS